MKKLKPIIDREKYSNQIEAKIKKVLYDRIFKKLFDFLKEEMPKAALKANAGQQEALLKAIYDGKVIYEGGYILGSFNAKTSRAIREIGGTWNKLRKGYKLSTEAIPPDVKAAFAQQRSRTLMATQKINDILDEAALEHAEIEFEDEVKVILEDLNSQFQKTAAKELEIPMEMTKRMAEELKTDYFTNLNLYIKKWQDEQIFRLRKQVSENTVQGFRASNLVQAIRAEYGVSENKARFLARNETSILISKYREQNYKKSGVRKYQWSSSLDSRVRHDHKMLHGKIFSWDNPPIVDQSSGRRAHPGEDYLCRCVAIPLLEERKHD